MLRCRDIEHHASEYLDNELSGVLRLRFRMHLLICRNCRRYLRQLQLTVTSLQHFKPATATDRAELTEKMRRQVAESDQPLQ